MKYCTYYKLALCLFPDYHFINFFFEGIFFRIMLRFFTFLILLFFTIFFFINTQTQVFEMQINDLNKNLGYLNYSLIAFLVNWLYDIYKSKIFAENVVETGFLWILAWFYSNWSCFGEKKKNKIKVYYGGQFRYNLFFRAFIDGFVFCWNPQHGFGSIRPFNFYQFFVCSF